EVRGAAHPNSGYRHEITHTLQMAEDLPNALQPILDGIPQAFDLTDELYLAPVFEGDVIPLIRSSHTFTEDGFYSATLALQGQMFSREGWSHPQGSNLVGWVKRAQNSPLVYLQPGDGPDTYANPHYRKLVENAIRWAASDGAKEWARSA
ncbi:MAG: ThuA domain-containing protein, partial [Pseudomonadota bacterium]